MLLGENGLANDRMKEPVNERMEERRSKKKKEKRPEIAWMGVHRVPVNWEMHTEGSGTRWKPE